MELGLFTVLFAGQPLEEALDCVVEAGLDDAAPDLAPAPTQAGGPGSWLSRDGTPG